MPRAAFLVAWFFPMVAAAERVELNAGGDVSWPSIGFALGVVDEKGPEMFAPTKPYLARGCLLYTSPSPRDS